MPSIEQMRAKRKDSFEPHWRHFHPQSRVWVKNPFNFDIIFYVADEANQQWKYSMRRKSISELPGGAVATLGVKEIVDRLINENPKDAIHVLSLRVRKQYEDKIIVKEKDPPQRAAAASGNREIDLSAGVSEEDLRDDDDDGLDVGHDTVTNDDLPPPEDNDPAPKPTSGERSFPGAKQTGNRRGLDKVREIASASEPTKKDQIIEE
jgi:hypothetical protein